MRNILAVTSLLALTFAAPVAAASAATSAADQAAIKGYLTRIFNSYRECVMDPRAANPDAKCPSAVPWNSVFTPDTRRLIALDTVDGEATAANDSDPIIASQDPGSIKVNQIALTPRADGRVMAKVAFQERFAQMPPRTRLRTLVMERVGAGWRVHDIIETNGSTYRKTIIEDAKLYTKHR